jgi:two-component system, NarL family, nitrate/nitrite response regulator NarL
MQSQSVLLQSDSTPVRIVIAAAQAPFRKLLRRHLEAEPQVQVVGVASDTRTACTLTRRLNPDILVIECALNRKFSECYSSRRGNSGYATGVLVIIETPRIQDIVEAFELGARGVVLRGSLPLVWRTGIQSILAGQYWVEDKSVALLLEAVRGFLDRPEAKRLPEFGLTMREMEIAGKIASGRSNKDVGREFSICERTVKHHLTNIFKKVGVSSRLELAVLLRDKIAPQLVVPNTRQSNCVTGQDDESLERSHLYLVSES